MFTKFTQSTQQSEEMGESFIQKTFIEYLPCTRHRRDKRNLFTPATDSRKHHWKASN
jgi:hypothetical protein